MNLAFSISPGTMTGDVLDADDVRRLLDSATIDRRIEVLEKVSRQYDSAKLTPSEMAIAEQIFRHLVGDSALRIRRALSQSLAENPALPHDIALAMAKDVESVATPVLEMSRVLSDADLIDIVRHSEEIWRYLAIARRPALSEPLSAALIDGEYGEVTVEVLNNPHAAVSDEIVERLSARVEDEPELAQSLARRAHLPVEAIERLLRVVSGDLAEKLRERITTEHGALEAKLREVEERAALNLLLMPAGPEASEALVERFHREGRLDPSVIIQALCHGNIDFFEAALAKLSGVPLANAQLLTHDKGDLGFRALYAKAGLPAAMLSAVRHLFEAVLFAIEDEAVPGTSHFSNMVVSRVLEDAQTHEVENLSYVLAIIRQPG